VPPETTRSPRSISRSARAWALATTCWLVGPEAWLERLSEGHRLAATNDAPTAPLAAGETTALSTGWPKVGVVGEDQAARGHAGLVGGRDHMAMGNGAGCTRSGDQGRDVGHVRQKVRRRLVGDDGAEPAKIIVRGLAERPQE